MARKSSGMQALLPVLLVGVLMFFGVIFAPLIFGSTDEAHPLDENDTYKEDYDAATGFLKLGLNWETMIIGAICIFALVIGLLAFTRH